METTFGVIVAIAIIGYGIYRVIKKDDDDSVGSGGTGGVGKDPKNGYNPSHK